MRTSAKLEHVPRPAPTRPAPQKAPDPNDAAPWAEPAKRLRDVLGEYGWTNAELAAKAGITPNTAGYALSGNTVVRGGTLQKICRALQLNDAWAKWGKGPKWVDGAVLPAHMREPHAPAPLSSDGRPIGVESWLSEQRGVEPDEQNWLKSVPWLERHTKYPDAVYLLALSAYRQMRDYERLFPIKDKSHSAH